MFKRWLSIARTRKTSHRQALQRNVLRFEALEERCLLAADFHLLALIYPEIEDNGTSVSIDEATLNALVKGAQIELPTLVNQLAGDQMQVRVHVEVVDRVLQARSDGLVFDSMVEPDLNEFTKSG